jgi:hypothetical protein
MSNEKATPAIADTSLLPQYSDDPLFPLGQVVATPGALEHCAKNDISPLTLIGRHHRGDWGDLCEDDRSANERERGQDVRRDRRYIQRVKVP